MNITISEAILATLATLPLFSSISIFKDATTFDYVGGDITLSNPIRELIAEAYGCFGSEEHVACLLSLGCGNSGVIHAPDDSSLSAWNSFLVKLVASSEKEAQMADAQMGHLGIYLRFSVNRGLETSSLDTAVTAGTLLMGTVAYLDDTSLSERLDDCVELLRIRDGTASLEQLSKYGTYDCKHAADIDTERSGGEKILPPPLPPLTDTFVMRKKPWRFIEKAMLGPRNSADDSGKRMLLVTGMGGCGKTQIIRKFIQVHSKK